MGLLRGIYGADGPSPSAGDAWLISRICEHFHCTPSAAARELEAPTSFLMLDAMRMREFVGMAQEFKRWEDSPVPAKGDKRDCPLSDHQQAVLDRVARAAEPYGGFV